MYILFIYLGVIYIFFYYLFEDSPKYPKISPIRHVEPSRCSLPLVTLSNNNKSLLLKNQIKPKYMYHACVY